MHKNLEKTKGFPCKNLKKVGIVYRELCSSMCKLSRLIKQQTKKIKGIEIVFIRNLGSFEHGSLFDRLKLEEDETIGDDNSITVRSSQSETLQSLQSAYGQESPSCRRRVRFELPLPRANSMDPQVRDELNALIEAKHAGVAYIMGHSYVKARRNSSFLKKFVIDVAYSFLRKNCRGPSVALHIPHISLIEYDNGNRFHGLHGKM